MRVRVLTCLALLAFAAPAAATETIRVGPDTVAEYTSQTILQAGKTYTLAVTGTDRSDEGEGNFFLFDAAYCYEATTYSSYYRDQCNTKDLNPQVFAKQSGYDLQLFSDDGGSLPYAADHRYVSKWKAPSNGPVKVSWFITGRPAGAKYSGGFTVTIEEPGIGKKKCAGKQATITGDEDEPTGVTRIFGTTGADVIVGTAGEDAILGGGGNDLICAGGGVDHVNGGGGNDVILGEGAGDTLIGNDGDDHLFGGPGEDGLRGGAGWDVLRGEGDNDTLDGGKPGTGTGWDVVDGGADEDSLIGRHALTIADFRKSPKRVLVNMAQGWVRGYGYDTVGGIQWINGTRFNDVMRGSPARDVFYGGPGRDTLYGLAGRDKLIGGEGEQDLADGGSDLDTCEAERTEACEHAP